MTIRMWLVPFGLMASLSLLSWLLAAAPPPRKLVLLIHGGEGDMTSKSPGIASKQKKVLEEALRQGYARLKQGKKNASLDAVEAAIRVLEDSPLFNAGKGAVFTHDGRNELDASIMEGKSKKAGAVAGVSIIKNPIGAARAVMEQSPHVLLVGRRAEMFALEHKLDIVPPAYFRTEERWKQLQDALRKEEKRRRKDAPSPPTPLPRFGGEGSKNEPSPPSGGAGRVRETHQRHLGTVGAVALDGDGTLAAGTSTGGMNNKWSGRVGDSPIIGAGTYADNDACAVSCTGWGEYFIRFAVAHDITARVKYSHMSVKAAAELVVGEELQKAGAEGGAIVLGRDGAFHMVYNRLAGQMSRGYITSEDGKPHVTILDKPASKAQTRP